MTAETWRDTNEGEDEADDAVLALLVHVQNNSSRKGDPRESGGCRRAQPCWVRLSLAMTARSGPLSCMEIRARVAASLPATSAGTRFR